MFLEVDYREELPRGLRDSLLQIMLDSSGSKNHTLLFNIVTLTPPHFCLVRFFSRRCQDVTRTSASE
jgi:hypothetical protein